VRDRGELAQRSAAGGPRARPAWALGLVALSVAAGCSRQETPPSRTAGARPNVLLVTIDTQRADRLGCYGHARAVTPTLDGLAARGARFETAVSHAPLTAPSHASILTGLTPLGHGVRDNGAYVLPASVRSLPEDFRAAGYRTAGFVSGFPLKRRFGFDRGFETYDDALPRGKDARRTAYVERTADRTTDAALHWLDTLGREGDARPFFLWVHYFDPHAPYEAPAEFMANGAAPYDGETAFVDAQLKRLLRRVDERGGALVLATADHGESLGEHGEDTHGIFVYDATIRVPFLLAGPGVKPGVVSRTVARGIDVLPTLLDLAGLAPRATEGRSLRRAASGEELADAPSYAESLHPQLQYGWAPLHAWRSAGFKLIEAPRPELYDLAADPGETRDRAARDAARLDAMRSELQRAIAAVATPVAGHAVDAETRERLAALGYVGTAGGGAPVLTGRDPKDGIGLVTRLGRNGMTVARTEPEKAIRELTALLAEDPGMLVVLRTRAVAYAAAGRPKDAVRDLRELETRGALSAEDAVVLGDNLRLAGHPDEAVRVLERTLAQNPTFAQPLLSIAAVRMQQRDVKAAAAAFGKVSSRATRRAPRASTAGSWSSTPRTRPRSPSSASRRCASATATRPHAPSSARWRATRKAARRCSTSPAPTRRAAARARRRPISSARSRPARRRPWRGTGSASHGSSSETAWARQRRCASRCGSSRTSPRWRGRCGRSDARNQLAPGAALR